MNASPVSKLSSLWNDPNPGSVLRTYCTGSVQHAYPPLSTQQILYSEDESLNKSTDVHDTVAVAAQSCEAQGLSL